MTATSSHLILYTAETYVHFQNVTALATETYKDPYDYAPNMSGTMLPGDLMQESDAVKNELLYQRQLRENFERRMESKLTNLQVQYI